MGKREFDLIDLAIQPGIFTEQSKRGAKGRWRNGNNVRFHEGLPEKIGGYLRQQVADQDGNLNVSYIGSVRSVLDWASLDGQRWVAFGTECKLYLISQGILFDITPSRRITTVMDPFTTSIGSTLVTVLDPGNGANDGDHVRYTNATAVAGLTLNGQFDIVEVIDLDHYTINAATPANANATGGGGVTMEYDISCGLAEDGFLSGYGTGPYGEETYGTARSNSTFPGRARIWSLQQWGEDLVASPNGETLYWWDRTLGPDARAVAVPGAPSSIERLLVSQEQRQAIALGSTNITNDVEDPMLVRWCASEDFFTWIPVTDLIDGGPPVNDAGSQRLNVGSRIVTGIRSRGQSVIWTDIALYTQQFVGDPNIFSFQQIGEAVQIIGPNAAAEIDGVVFFMALNDFYIYDGTLRVLPCDVWTRVFKDPNIAVQRSKVYARINSKFNEVWFHCESPDNGENLLTVIYNYQEQSWCLSDFAREASSDTSPTFGFPFAFLNGEIFLHEDGVNADTFALETLLESFDMEIVSSNLDPSGASATVNSGNQIMIIGNLIPDFLTLVGTPAIQLSLLVKEYPSRAAGLAGPYPIDATTSIVYNNTSGRQVALRLESGALDQHWRFGTLRAYAGPHGKRGVGATP